MSRGIRLSRGPSQLPSGPRARGSAGERRRATRALLIAAALAACAGCAPTTLAPAVVRLTPGDGARSTGSLGLRTGPRLTTPLTSGSSIFGGGFAGDKNVFAVPQWGLAYDAAMSIPLAPATRLHLGAQGEFYYPVPLPAYGLYTGLSRRFAFGPGSITPALVGHFATDFGLGTVGGPGTQLGGELCVTLGWQPEQRIAVGLVPFAGLHRLWARDTATYAIYTGAALVARLQLGNDSYEFSGGFGRVFMPQQDLAWNAPIIGLRTGQ